MGNHLAMLVDESPAVEDLAKQFKSKDADHEEQLLNIDYGDTSVDDKEIIVEEIENATRRILYQSCLISSSYTALKPGSLHTTCKLLTKKGRAVVTIYFS